jgi:hypothetical protein
MIAQVQRKCKRRERMAIHTQHGVEVRITGKAGDPELAGMVAVQAVDDETWVRVRNAADLKGTIEEITQAYDAAPITWLIDEVEKWKGYAVDLEKEQGNE